MDLLIFNYILWQAFTLVALILLYGLIPIVGIFFALCTWPDEEKPPEPDPAYRRHSEKKKPVEPVPFKLKAGHAWTGVIVVCTIVLSGAQISWMHMPDRNSASRDTRQKFNQTYDQYREQVKRENAAEAPIVRTDLKTEIRRYELVSWNPPKHFYVTIEDVVTHGVYPSVYVSKHCNTSGQLKAGQEYNISVTTYTLSNQPGTVYTEFADLYAVFCGG